MTTTDRNPRGGAKSLLRLSLALLVLATAGAFSAAPAATAASGPGWGDCLDCHEDESLSLTTSLGEELSLTVATEGLAASPHRGLACQACHPGVDLDEHPTGEAIASLEKYRITSAKVCLTCHTAERLRSRPQHAAIVFEDQQLSCVECHGAHGVRSVAAWKREAGADGYCLICHSRAISVQGPDGAGIPLAVDPDQLKASVHPDHECTDCHSTFSAGDHPVGPPGDRNRRSLAATRTCAQCHEEKLRQAEGSIHFTLLRSGSGKAPGCTGCHSAHGVAPTERFATLAGTPCRACHAEIFKAYSGSMHGVARASGEHLDAPMCSECHRAHDVQGTAHPEQVRAACLGCHEGAGTTHAAWLPNASLHLEAVSCAACHVPMAQRVVALRLVEEGSGRQLTEREVADLIGSDVAAAISSAGNGDNLWTAMRRLESRRLASAAKLHIVGRLEIARGVDAHRLAGKSGAVRDCESCHTRDSKVFDQVALTLARDDGRPKRFEGEREMLTDAASVVSIHGFYALGATRVAVLDWLLVLAVAGGLSVIALHLTFRIRAGHARREG